MKTLDEKPIYYVYEHYRPGEDEPFYVGKGSGNRAFNKMKRNTWWKRIVLKYGVVIKFVAENLSETTALWVENMCIVGWGRANLKEGPLVNLTDGGESCSGYIPTASTKKKISKNHADFSGSNHPNFGRKRSAAWKRKYCIGKAHPMYGKHHSRKAKLRISKASSGSNNPMFGVSIKHDKKRRIQQSIIMKKIWKMRKQFTEN